MVMLVNKKPNVIVIEKTMLVPGIAVEVDDSWLENERIKQLMGDERQLEVLSKEQSKEQSKVDRKDDPPPDAAA